MITFFFPSPPSEPSVVAAAKRFGELVEARDLSDLRKEAVEALTGAKIEVLKSGGLLLPKASAKSFEGKSFSSPEEVKCVFFFSFSLHRIAPSPPLPSPLSYAHFSFV